MPHLKKGSKGTGKEARRRSTAHKTANQQKRRSQASPDGAGAGAGAGNVQDENAPPALQRRRVGVPFLFGWFGAVVCAVKRPCSQFSFPALCSRRRRPAHRGGWGGSGRPRPDGRAGLHVYVSSPPGDVNSLPWRRSILTSCLSWPWALGAVGGTSAAGATRWTGSGSGQTFGPAIWVSPRRGPSGLPVG